MIDMTQPVNTGHRAGRMLEGLLATENTKAKVLLTTDVLTADGESRYHQTFRLRRWVARDGGRMMSVQVEGSADWERGIPPTNVLTLDLDKGECTEARPRRGDHDRLLVYAAVAAVKYAWLGVLPTPANGSVTVLEASHCGRCGRTLTDPLSIDRGIGPECAGKATGTTTIRGRKRAQPTEGQEALA